MVAFQGSESVERSKCSDAIRRRELYMGYVWICILDSMALVRISPCFFSLCLSLSTLSLLKYAGKAWG